MTTSPDQIYDQVDAAAKIFEKMPAREREQKPHKEFGENYNSLLSLAKESMPNVDVRRWPPKVEILQPSVGPKSANCRYVEIHSYYKQILAILAEGIEPPISGLVG